MNAKSEWLSASEGFFHCVQKELSVAGWVPWEPEPIYVGRGSETSSPDAYCLSREMAGGHLAVLTFVRSGELKARRQQFGFLGSVSVRSVEIGKAFIANRLHVCMQLIEPQDFELRLEKYGVVLVNFAFERLISRLPPIITDFANACSRWECVNESNRNDCLHDVVGVIGSHVEPLLNRLDSASELIATIIAAGKDVPVKDVIATSSLPSVFAALLTLQVSGPSAALEIMRAYERDLAERQRAGRYPRAALTELRCMHQRLETAWHVC